MKTSKTVYVVTMTEDRYYYNAAKELIDSYHSVTRVISEDFFKAIENAKSVFNLHGVKSYEIETYDDDGLHIYSNDNEEHVFRIVIVPANM